MALLVHHHNKLDAFRRVHYLHPLQQTSNKFDHGVFCMAAPALGGASSRWWSTVCHVSRRRAWHNEFAMNCADDPLLVPSE